MGFWKVLGGVAAGIGVVVALPIAGPIGAVSAIGAAVAGTIGAAAGGVASIMDDEEKESARHSGERTATAKYELREKQLIEALTEAKNRSKDDKAFFELFIPLFAIGMATANADGNVTEDELIELNEFCFGLMHTNLPPHVKQTVEKLKNNPPTFNEAMEYVKKFGGDIDPSIFELVIQTISESDGYVTRDEEALMTAFRIAVA